MKERTPTIGPALKGDVQEHIKNKTRKNELKKNGENIRAKKMKSEKMEEPTQIDTQMEWHWKNALHLSSS